METAKLWAACAFSAGLVITLFLAAYLTPNQWCRRANARALLIMVVGAWGFGSLLLYAFQGAAPVAAGTLQAPRMILKPGRKPIGQPTAEPPSTRQHSLYRRTSSPAGHSRCTAT